MTGWDMRSCPSALVLSVSPLHAWHGNVAPVCKRWAPEFSVCAHTEQLLSSGRWDDLGRTSRRLCPVLHQSAIWLTPNSGGTLKCYTAPKVRFLALCYTPSAFGEFFIYFFYHHRGWSVHKTLAPLFWISQTHHLHHICCKHLPSCRRSWCMKACFHCLMLLA